MVRPPGILQTNETLGEPPHPGGSLGTSWLHGGCTTSCSAAATLVDAACGRWLLAILHGIHLRVLEDRPGKHRGPRAPFFIRRWADARFSLAGLVSPPSPLLPPDLFLDSEKLCSMLLLARERGRAQARVRAMQLLPRRGTPMCGACRAFPHVSWDVAVATPAVAQSPHDAAARAGAASRVRWHLAAVSWWSV